MRILFENLSPILSVTKKLATAAHFQLSQTRDEFAKAAGYKGWHELQKVGPSPMGGTPSDRLDISGWARFVARISGTLGLMAGDVQYLLSRASLLPSDRFSVVDQLNLRAEVFRLMEIPDLGRRQPGAVGKFRYDSEPLLLKQFGGATLCMSHGSYDVAVADFEYVTPKISIPLFVPRRLYFPYGVWTEADGSRVLFSRDYLPLWRLRPDDSPERLHPLEWIDFVEQEWFWGDESTPWEKKMRVEDEMRRLNQFGIVHVPKLVEILPAALLDRSSQSIRGAAERIFGPKVKAA